MLRILRCSTVTATCKPLASQGSVTVAHLRSVASVASSITSRSQSADRCCKCHQLQQTEFHSSASLLKTPVYKSKKKLVESVKLRKAAARKASWEIVSIRQGMTVQELADTLNKDVDDIFEVMLFVDYTNKYDKPTSVIDDLQVIKEIVDKTGFRYKLMQQKVKIEKVNKDAVRRPLAEKSKLEKRPPVVTIMGHVDHGKTTLLDALRESNIVQQEFGGITQHIGAFSVTLASGDRITFLDTPGHAAFSAMRARGANITDIVILVVAADDGIMQQTVECIQHIQAAGVPVVIAINKIDRPAADPERIKHQLLQHSIQLEEFGGDAQMVQISALKKTNLTGLQETVVTLAEVLELKAEKSGLVEASVIESRIHPGRGKVSTALVQRGTLRKGACLVAGTAWAKVRSMFDDQGRPLSKVEPGMAAEVTGWKDLPSAGDEILEVESERRAKEVSEWRRSQIVDSKVLEDMAVIQKNAQEHNRLYQEARATRHKMGYRSVLTAHGTKREKENVEDSTPKVSIVLKGDVAGSVEVLMDTLHTYQSKQCDLSIVHSGVGDVTEEDIEKADAFNGAVYAFNVKCPANVVKKAMDLDVQVKYHNVIYKLVDELRKELTQRLPLVNEEEVLGEATVQELFMVSEGKHKRPVAGCRCTDGILMKKKYFKLVRDGKELVNGELSSLKHFKSEVDSIKSNTECGLSFADNTVIPQPGDSVICYQLKQVKPDLDWILHF